jgi:hypothetical protein
MKDVNTVRLTGTIFWSKLDDKQTYTILRLGIKLANGGSCFLTVNNPSTKAYDLIKSGNKVLVTAGFLDTWDKTDGTSEIQIKCNDSGIQFFPKEKVLPDINFVSVIGKVISYGDEYATVEMVGERNPKTDKPSMRKAKIKVGEMSSESTGSKVMIDAKVSSVEVEGKSKLVIEANYDTITVL